ncbi:hypothetical protein KP509_16G050300 [Ceratopteris richardii]|uniref:Retrotransposon Copia-like N-terminal domain-containing protein n=1 Tax=Ceratopteris richardii TaxID=49495 RepID=A0A8T2T370_CERRI|nr:hypothetical protein KP509_16G050300 [Ceratopteris richardii]
MANVDGMTQLMSDKLDKNNFHAWRFKMMNFLMGKGYWKYIEGENKNARQLQERNWIADQLRAYVEWNQGAQKVMYWLSVSIQDSMIGHIQDAKTPKEAWNSLLTLYETNTKAWRSQLKNKLHTLEKKSMSELHISSSKLTRENIPHFTDLVSMLIIEETNLGEDSKSQGKPNAKEGLNLEPNDKENAEKSSAESHILSGLDASPSNSSNSNPWSGRLCGNFRPANSSNTSNKGKEKLSAGHKTCVGFEDVDGDSSDSEKSLDEELGLPSVKTLGVRKAHVDDKRRSDPGPRISERMRNLVQRLTYDSYMALHCAYMTKMKRTKGMEEKFEDVDIIRWKKDAEEESPSFPKEK